ncbi:MAG: hypothetical protein JWP36_2825 [Paucimonas sp.]|nr:hypothetical protein [Paucimonas sp.]
MRWVGCVRLLSVLAVSVAAAGLSLAAQASAALPPSMPPSMLQSMPLLAQNDLLLSGEMRPVEAPASPPASAMQNGAGTPAMTGAGEPPAVTFPTQPSGTRIILLLPRRSPVFKAASDAVLEGFKLAAERDRDEKLRVTLVETGDDPNEVLASFQAAQSQADIIVGPLTRSGVTAVALNARVDKPTLALAQPEARGDKDPPLPQRMLPIGLSVEDEARQLARQAAADGHTGRAYIVATQAAWQKRAAQAFEVQWRQLRQTSETMSISANGAWLDANGLQQLKRRLEREQPALIFAALDADQASQVREAIGAQVPVFGTSQINPLPAGDWPPASRRPELDGVHLVDMPWLLQPDHPAVMAYRSGTPTAGRSADLERLVALGVDAWRIAREIAAYKAAFEIDGVTGKLVIDMSAGSTRFQRSASPGTYVDGMVSGSAP